MINEKIVNGILSLEKGSFVDYKTLGRRNRVVSFKRNGDYYICKIYDNKYFPNQAEHESNVLKMLSSEIETPKIVNEGVFKDKKYTVMTDVRGYAFEEELYDSYQLEASEYLKRLHDLKIGFNTVKVDSDHNDTFQKVLDNAESSIISKYLNQNFNGRTTLIHHNPHFRHFIKSKEGLYLIDWEDATIGCEVTDYASLVKDMIESSRPNGEISSFLDDNKGLESTINPYLGRLYMIDNHYTHCPKKSGDYNIKINAFFDNKNFYNAMEDIKK